MKSEDLKVAGYGDWNYQPWAFIFYPKPLG